MHQSLFECFVWVMGEVIFGVHSFEQEGLIKKKLVQHTKSQYLMPLSSFMLIAIVQGSKAKQSPHRSYKECFLQANCINSIHIATIQNHETLNFENKVTSMENLTATKIMHLFEPLNFNIKLELLSKITENVKKSYPTPVNKKRKLLNELFGAWSDVDDSIIEDIYSSRTISTREINLDSDD